MKALCSIIKRAILRPSIHQCIHPPFNPPSLSSPYNERAPCPHSVYIFHSFGRLNQPARWPSPLVFLMCWPLVQIQLFIVAFTWPWLCLGYDQYKRMIGERGPGSEGFIKSHRPKDGVKHGGEWVLSCQMVL